MNLFKKKKDTATPPGIDEAQQRIDGLKRNQKMSSRASSMLTAGQKPQVVARREITGN